MTSADSIRLASESRDNHLTLRRVERQQRLVELLSTAHQPVPSTMLGRELGLSPRTVERDLARLRESGAPIETMQGAHGAAVYAGTHNRSRWP